MTLVALLAMSTGAWAQALVTWDTSFCSNVQACQGVTPANNVQGGITVTYTESGVDAEDGFRNGTISTIPSKSKLTFTVSGTDIKITKIEIAISGTYDLANLEGVTYSTGWSLSGSTLVWSGEGAQSVDFSFANQTATIPVSQITFSKYKPAPTAPTLQTLTNDQDGYGWQFEMPNYNVLVEMLYEADFAWVRNENDSVKNTVLTGYAGFEFTPQPTLKMRYSDQGDEFKKLITYESSNREVALVNDTTGVVSLMGAGTAQIKAKFAGNDVYADTTVSYTINVQKPDTLFLVANPAGGAVFTVKGKEQLGSEEYKGIKYVGSDKYIVIPDTTVFIAATAAPGYHLNVTDPTKVKEGEYRDTLKMVTNTDRTVTVTLEENTYDLVLSAQTIHQITDGKATIEVNAIDKTDALIYNEDENVDTLKAVKYNQEIILKAQQGYKFRKVEVKKAPALIVNPEVGQFIGSDGKNYDANATLPNGVTKVALIAYVGSSTGDATYNHGLALALVDVSETKIWCNQTDVTCLGTQYDSSEKSDDLAGIDNTNALAGTLSDDYHAAAIAARNYNSGTHPDGTSEWFLPSAGQWDKMITAAGGYANLKTNANGYTGLQSDRYWSGTEFDSGRAWSYGFDGGGWDSNSKNTNYRVRACLAF